MFTFSERSKTQLATCHPNLKLVLDRALSYGIMDFTVLEGFRNQKDQDEAFRTGKSKLKWPNGKHNGVPSRAVDIAPFVNRTIPWDDTRYWYLLAGIILVAANECNIKIRTGWDWDGDLDLSDQNFNDLGHIELL